MWPRGCAHARCTRAPLPGAAPGAGGAPANQPAGGCVRLLRQAGSARTAAGGHGEDCGPRRDARMCVDASVPRAGALRPGHGAAEVARARVYDVGCMRVTSLGAHERLGECWSRYAGRSMAAPAGGPVEAAPVRELRKSWAVPACRCTRSSHGLLARLCPATLVGSGLFCRADQQLMCKLAIRRHDDGMHVDKVPHDHCHLFCAIHGHGRGVLRPCLTPMLASPADGLLHALHMLTSQCVLLTHRTAWQDRLKSASACPAQRKSSLAANGAVQPERT